MNITITTIKGPSASAPRIDVPTIDLPQEGAEIRARLEAMAVMRWDDLSMTEIHALRDRLIDLMHSERNGVIALAYTTMINGFQRLSEVAPPLGWHDELERIEIWKQQHERKEARMQLRINQAWARLRKAFNVKKNAL